MVANLHPYTVLPQVGIQPIDIPIRGSKLRVSPTESLTMPATAPKFVHIARQRRVGFASFSRTALCGRMVGVMSLGGESDATCQKCLAESLTMVQPPEVAK